ncbi:MAG: LLM class F420-dependent oxidoreductase [Chloroflexi bacterium]|nr:LLM class F420-dependent oxidoreductase [Chloroflexota bacterium]
MRVGVIFPQTEIGGDPAGVRDYAQAAEELGFAHLAIYDHVLGAGVANRPGWTRYSEKDMFHEPFVAFGYLAALTRTMELVTSIIILPQRQTVLVAKQAAEVDLLSGGRLRLGVGIGWNEVEYESLNEDFHTRGRRMEEQVAVMRALWTEPLVTFNGKWHHIDDAGLNPLPVQRPIPIWMGGSNEAVLKRIGAIADGWFPLTPINDSTRAAVERVRGYAVEAGRDPASVGLEARVRASTGTPEEWAASAAWWRDLGATHFSVDTMGGGLRGPDAHIAALRRFKETVGLA